MEKKKGRGRGQKIERTLKNRRELRWLLGRSKSILIPIFNRIKKERGEKDSEESEKMKKNWPGIN